MDDSRLVGKDSRRLDVVRVSSRLLFTLDDTSVSVDSIGFDADVDANADAVVLIDGSLGICWSCVAESDIEFRLTDE